jgi:predicted dehydrogenase
VYVATRHDQHFALARQAILAGKAVFVEKPMTMTTAEARELCDLVRERNAIVTVGFNRRFSQYSVMLKRSLDAIAAPKTIVYRVNAGPLPAGHWLLDPIEGGGRLLGEGVHFFDYMRFLVGADPVRATAAFPGGKSRDQGTVTIEFADGSVGTLIYSGDGSRDAGKERVEVFAGGATFILDDYRSLEVHGASQKGARGRKIDKGQGQQLQNLFAALNGEADLAVTAEDGYWATWCAEQAVGPVR